MWDVIFQSFYLDKSCLSDLKLPAGGARSACRFVDPWITGSPYSAINSKLIGKIQGRLVRALNIL